MKHHTYIIDRKIYHKSQLFTAIVLSVIMLSCTQQAVKDQQPITSLSKEIKEIHAGILEGYLSKDEIPNSLKLVPPPPEEGSAAFHLGSGNCSHVCCF